MLSLMLLPQVHTEHYNNMPKQYTAIFTAVKNDNFQLIFCLNFAQSIDCGYMLEQPVEVVLGERVGLVVNASDSGSRDRGFEPHSRQTVLCP